MGETYSCTFSNCSKVFSRAYELKKHKAAHEDPSSVFHCPRCDFITFKKRRLGIHFATHTGEKSHACPDMINFGGSERRCDYRTHDPAALSKHRKRVHGYVPPPNRSRPKATPAAPCKASRKKDEKVTRRCTRSQRPAPVSRRKPTHASRKANNCSSGPGYTSTLANPTPSLPLDGAGGDAMDVDCSEDFDYDHSSTTLVGSDDEVGLDVLFDPSLRPYWMAKFEASYSTFDMAGTTNQVEPILTDLPSYSAGSDMRTGQEGCLCPEWMVEAGVEGWDQSVLETYKEYYSIDA